MHQRTQRRYAPRDAVKRSQQRPVLALTFMVGYGLRNPGVVKVDVGGAVQSIRELVMSVVGKLPGIEGIQQRQKQQMAERHHNRPVLQKRVMSAVVTDHKEGREREPTQKPGQRVKQLVLFAPDPDPKSDCQTRLRKRQ